MKQSLLILDVLILARLMWVSPTCRVRCDGDVTDARNSPGGNSHLVFCLSAQRLETGFDIHNRSSAPAAGANERTI